VHEEGNSETENSALRWKIGPAQRERIQIVLLRESGMTQAAIEEAMGVSLTTVNWAHMGYDSGGISAGGRQSDCGSVLPQA
jgi:hypothetical protein